MPPCLGLVTGVEGMAWPPPGYRPCGLGCQARTFCLGALLPEALGYPKARVGPLNSTVLDTQKVPGYLVGTCLGEAGGAWGSASCARMLTTGSFQAEVLFMKIVTDLGGLCLLSPGWSLVVGAVALAINHTDPGQVTRYSHPQAECLLSGRTSVLEGRVAWLASGCSCEGFFSATIRDLVSLLVAMF